MTAPASDPVITLSGVSVRYGSQAVLEGVDLAIARGEFVALVGQSGAGKTTLLKTINRLARHDCGTVTVYGQRTDAVPPARLRRRIGYVFQGTGLFPHLTVAENIWISQRAAGQPASARDARVAELLDLVSLPADLGSRLPGQLSGGQAQRVGFARALAASPEIVLMDEPFGALDPVTRSELGEAYRRLHDRLALTSVMVTHDLAQALVLATRIVVLAGGKVVADLPPRELLHRAGGSEIEGMIDVVRGQTDRLAAMMERLS